jgi:hypothetical protein
VKEIISELTDVGAPRLLALAFAPRFRFPQAYRRLFSQLWIDRFSADGDLWDFGATFILGLC